MDIHTSAEDNHSLRQYALVKQDLAAAIHDLRQFFHVHEMADGEDRCQALLVKLAEDRFNLAVLGQLLGEAERSEVLGFVQTRLEQIIGSNGLRLYPVSARDALQAKLAGDSAQLERSGLLTFEGALADFFGRGEKSGVPAEPDRSGAEVDSRSRSHFHARITGRGAARRDARRAGRRTGH